MDFRLLSDQKILEALAHRFRALRLERNITQSQLAADAGIGVATLRRFERGEGNLSLLNMIALMKALDCFTQLEHFLEQPGDSPMQTLRSQGSGYLAEPQQRQRASGERSRTDETGWEWGDDA